MDRIKFRIIFGVLTISLALLSLSARADILNVPDDFETIQEAIDASDDRDTVLVQHGEYVENINFNGKNILLLGDPENPEEVIINANGEGRVVTIDMVENEAVLMGFTITGGHLVRGEGAGIFVMESSVVIRNCRTVENRTRNSPPVWGRGAGIDCSSSELTLTDCVFLDNRSGRYGGAIQCLLESVLNISNCEFNHNGGSEGAHIGCWESELNIAECEFTDGRGGDDGDYRYGIYLRNTVASIENTNFHDDFNAIVTSSSDVTVNGCTFDRNYATGEPARGGALNSFGDSHVIVTRSVFTHNWAFDGGHAVNCYEESEVLLINCTITQHEERAGSILSGVTVLNSIVWGNGSDWYQNTTFAFSNVQDGDDDNGNIDADPLFVDPDEGDYHLTEDSPCIDTGDPESDLDPDGTRADMGAFCYHQRDIDVDPDTLEFVGIQTGTVDSLAVIVRNVGLTILNLTSVGIASFNAPLDVDEIEEALPIAPDSSYTIWVRFLPFEEDQYLANLIIESDDPDEATVEVLISASALSVSDDIQAPLSFGINEVYPNPFNASTTISYQLPHPANVLLVVYDLRGRLVDTLIDERLAGGIYSTTWQPDNLASGLYFVRLETAVEVATQKVMLIR